MHPHTLQHLVRAILVMCAFLAIPGATSAWASVAFRAATCAQSSNLTTVLIPVPAGTVVGDLIVASVGFAKSASVATPSGWTQVPSLRGTVNSEQELVTWYRFATAAEPASYTFTSGSGTDAIAGGLSVFSGASPTAPIAAGAGQTIQSSITTSDTLPNATATRAGSIRYSAIGSDDLTTTTYSGGLSKVCDEGNESGVDIATSIAWQPTGAGTTATRTVSRSDNARSVMHTLVISPPACGTGSLNFASPTAIAFPAHTLSGYDTTVATITSASVDDQSSAHIGWSLSGTSTTFTNGPYTLPTTAAAVTGVSANAGSGNCSMPTNAITYPQTVPAAASAPTAIKLYNAASGSGAGPVDLDLALSLAIPGRTHVGDYTSTWTLTLATGP